MSRPQKQEEQEGTRDKPLTEQSPAEKLGHEPPELPVPGAQNPESDEVKREINPNTE